MSHIFISPLTRKAQITSNFAHHKNTGRQGGIDLVYADKNSFDNPILSVCDGVVKAIENNFIPKKPEAERRRGEKWIYIESLDGKFAFLYLHNNKNLVVLGQKVKCGEQIATMGFTGHTEPNNIQGTHLHFELRKNIKGIFTQVDPEKYCNFNKIFMQEEIETLKKQVHAANNSLDFAQRQNNDLTNEVKKFKENDRILNEIVDDLRRKIKEKDNKIWQIEDKLEKFVSQDTTLRELINEIGAVVNLKICEGQKHGEFTKLIIEKIKTL